MPSGNLEFPLPIEHNVKLPYNRPLVSKIFSKLNIKLQRDPDYYHKFMAKLLNKDYALPVEKSKTPGNECWLSHHRVVNSSGKFRVVCSTGI